MRRLGEGISALQGGEDVNAQKYGLPVSTIRSRLRAGDTGEALFRPVSIKPNAES
jgi:hypothetical protein